MKLIKVGVLVFVMSFLTHCSGSGSNDVDDTAVVEVDEDTDKETDENENNDDNQETDDDEENKGLSQRYVFDDNLVIENSYNTGGCDSPPCTTISESLEDVFENDDLPDDPYFYISEDKSELNLLCQLDKGRRIEFKQSSEGPLISHSSLEMEGVYYDVPNNGVTIAQVHNRGGNSNKPFFRLVLHPDGLETVVRKDPEVSSNQTSFSKEEFDFLNGTNYTQFPLKVIVEKLDGLVHISVTQEDTVILNKFYAPDSTTDWVKDTGIANGFYLKGGLYNDDGPHTKDLIVGYTSVIFTTNDD